MIGVSLVLHIRRGRRGQLEFRDWLSEVINRSGVKRKPCRSKIGKRRHQDRRQMDSELRNGTLQLQAADTMHAHVCQQASTNRIVQATNKFLRSLVRMNAVSLKSEEKDQ